MSIGAKILATLLTLAAIALALTVQQLRVNDAEARATAAESKAAQLGADLSDARANTKVVTQYVDRLREIRVKGDTIIQKVPVYVTKEADAACTVPVGFVRLHDAAAANLQPGDPGDADAGDSGVALSAVAETVADNYTTCHAVVAQLDALKAKLRASPYVTIESTEEPAP
ncbi:hypothetical protein DBB29_03000 [Pandoraea cepalis]|uniref:Uncharacterized protein n=1 Tax=Pandoraea cepalis TaxID=2508294 RepID=A0AAW7MIS0_9BURK|nr:hypothetical protein [Pandoraea cepalis]MDN4572673.1 hypothetical protein [Pandoraea cepalis]MDN4577088.1 hypothetical protein [Pandoraea cepalis]